jgi:hypothetical protein
MAFEYCRVAGRSALPASPQTLCTYLGTLFEAGSIRVQSLQPYVTAIGAQLCHFCQPYPMSHELFKLARRIFAAADARRHSGAPLQSSAYPATAAALCLTSALSAADISDFRFWAVVCVRFFIIARPASVLALSPDAVRISGAAVTLELRVFKHGESGSSPRVSLLMVLVPFTLLRRSARLGTLHHLGRTLAG